MCIPLAAGIAAVSTGLSIAGSIAEHKAQSNQARENREAALINHQLRSNANFARAAEIETSESERVFSAAVESARAQGRIAASSSARGVAGESIGRLNQGVDAEIGRGLRLSELQGEIDRNQLRRGQSLSRETLRRDIASNQGPSGLSLGLGIASSVVRGAGSVLSVSPGAS